MTNDPPASQSSHVTAPRNGEVDSFFLLGHAPKITPTLAAIVRAAQLCDRWVTPCQAAGSQSIAPIALELREQIDVVFAFHLGETTKSVFANEVPVAAPE